MAIRQNFKERLDEIQANVIRMGSDAAEMVKMAVDAAINCDIELAARVVAMDDDVDAAERDTYLKAVMTVMVETPVASDLRSLVATLGIVGEIEKVADDAVKLARRSTKLQNRFPVELKVALQSMGEQTRHMFCSSLRLYSDYSDALAAEIIDADDVVDSDYGKARKRVIDLIEANPHEAKHLVRTIEAFHAVEHVADHAVEIARRMRLLYDQPTPSTSDAS